MKRPYSNNFERDYNFYLDNASKFTFAPAYEPDIEFSDSGADAKYCFWKFDSTGKLLPCREPDLLRSLLICKKSVNFHIKLWAEGFRDMGMSKSEYLKEFRSSPIWVKQAFESQVKRVCQA